MSAAETAKKTELTRPAAELVETARQDLAAEPTDALKERLTSLLARTADDLREMAAIVAELEARGEDLSALRLGIVDHLRRIAAGQLLPEVVVRFSGFPQLLRVAVHLPLPDQRRLADGEPVELAVYREGQPVDFRQVDPLCLSRDQLNLVFAGDRMRPRTEQVALLESRRERVRTERPVPKRRAARADRDRGGIVIGRAFAPLADVLAALADLAGSPLSDDDDDDEATVVLKLPAGNHTRLKVLAAQSGTTMNDLVRRALHAHGLFRGEEE